MGKQFLTVCFFLRPSPPPLAPPPPNPHTPPPPHHNGCHLHAEGHPGRPDHRLPPVAPVSCVGKRKKHFFWGGGRAASLARLLGPSPPPPPHARPARPDPPGQATAGRGCGANPPAHQGRDQARGRTGRPRRRPAQLLLRRAKPHPERMPCETRRLRWGGAAHVQHATATGGPRPHWRRSRPKRVDHQFGHALAWWAGALRGGRAARRAPQGTPPSPSPSR